MVSRKRNPPKCEFQIEDIKMKQRFMYIGSVLAENGKRETEICCRTAIANNASLNVSKSIKKQKEFSRNKNELMNCYVICIPLYDSEG